MTPSTLAPKALDRILRPQAIAVLGASARPGALSGRFINGLHRHGFAGEVLPVNPKRDEVLGHRAYPAIGDAVAAQPVDLAVVSLPKEHVLDALEQCARAGVAGALVFSSGFAESGEQGAAEQAQLGELARSSQMRVIGPNSPGFINVTDSVCVATLGVTFREQLEAGGVGVIAQSGGALGLIVNRALDAGVGVSTAIATGNEADLTVGELLPWFAADPATKSVALFVEGIRRPEQLRAGFAAMRQAGKPVVIVKAGAGEAAARATAAHTGALASSDDVVDAALSRDGIVRVRSIEELVHTTATLERLGPSAGRKVGIITTSGGMGVLATEAAERQGLDVAPLAPTTAEKLEVVLPDFASLQNPADMSGMFAQDPEIFRNALHAFGEATEFDSLVLVLTVHPTPFGEELADRLIEYRDRVGTPPAILWTAGDMNLAAIRRLRKAGLAIFEDPDLCMRALAARAELGAARDAEMTSESLVLSLPEARNQLSESEALELFAAAGVPVIAATTCATPEEAAATAEAAGGPVAIKALARDLAHKSDAGAVVLNVSGGAAAATAHERVVAAASAVGATVEGSVVEPMAEPGFELIVGARTDPDFGPVLVVGPGGIAAELSKDVSRRLLPLREGEAVQMLRELRCFPLLDGYRGLPLADVAAAAAAIEAFGQLALAIGDRLEAVEANPLLVHQDGAGATAVDGLIRLLPPS